MLWDESRTSGEFRLSMGGFLSWLFRGFETYVLIVALGPILESLLSPFAASSLYFYAGIALAATLFGWAIGGIVRGITVRFIGRRNTATYSVLGYAAFTGLTALSQSFLVFIALRFLTGIMLGSEGERGTILLGETHSDDRRARGAGSVHAGFGCGILLASTAWFALEYFNLQVFPALLGMEAWRYLFAIGVLPAIFVLYLRRTAQPSEIITGSKETSTGDERETAQTGSTEDRESGTLTELFEEGPLRRRVVVSVVLLFAATAGWWGVTTWIPVYASTIAEASGLANPDQWAGVTGAFYGIGAIAGSITAKPIADRIGRTGSLMVMLIGTLATVPVLYLLVRTPYFLLPVVAVVGYFTFGQFGWFAVHLSELFPREIRETALGTVYTGARLLAVMFPLLVGIEITLFEGITTVVASFGVVYGIGIFATLFLPSGMERMSSRTDSDHLAAEHGRPK